MNVFNLAVHYPDACCTFDSQHAIPNLTACSAYGGELKTTMHYDCFVGYV